MTANPIPPVIWLDLTQARMGYTSTPETVEPGDVAFVPQDIAAARVAAAYEAAADAAIRHTSKIQVNDPLWHEGQDWAADRISRAIRDLTPADAKDTLARVLAEAEERRQAAEEALRQSLRVLRRLTEEYFCGCSLRHDPASISRDEFDMAADDMDAIRAAEAVIGPVEDFLSVDTAFLNACLAEYDRRQAAAERQVP